MPGGVMMCLLHGNPTKEPHLLMMKMVEGTTILPHWHSADETVVVQSGTIIVGNGGEIDESKGVRMCRGSYFRIPAKVPHWALVREEVIIIRYTNGVADIQYINK